MMAYGNRIAIKTRAELEKMREAARHVAETLLEVRAHAKPGVTTAELNRMAERCIEQRGVESSFLGYGPGGAPPYPAVMCISTNEEIVHGIRAIKMMGWEAPFLAKLGRARDKERGSGPRAQ